MSFPQGLPVTAASLHEVYPTQLDFLSYRGSAPSLWGLKHVVGQARHVGHPQQSPVFPIPPPQSCPPSSYIFQGSTPILGLLDRTPSTMEGFDDDMSAALPRDRPAGGAYYELDSHHVSRSVKRPRPVKSCMECR